MDTKLLAEIGLKSAKQAARKVRKDAYLNQRKIPVWINGKTEFIIPEDPDNEIPDNEDKEIKPE